MIRRRSIAVAVSAAAGLGLSLALAPASSAAPISSSQRSAASGPAVRTAQLRVTGHSSSYGLLSAGTPQVLRPASADICGTGFVNTNVTVPDNDGKYQEKTGFTGASPGAVAYTWAETIVVSHAGQVVDHYSVHQSGGLASRSSWTGQHTATTTDTPATYTVTVDGTWFLRDGEACFAAGTITGYVP